MKVLVNLLLQKCETSKCVVTLYAVLLFCFGVGSVDFQRGYCVSVTRFPLLCIPYISIAVSGVCHVPNSPSWARFIGMSWVCFKTFLLSIGYTPSISPWHFANDQCGWGNLLTGVFPCFWWFIAIWFSVLLLSLVAHKSARCLHKRPVLFL
jgi:hypothetical protein